MYWNLIEMIQGTRRRQPSDSVVVLRELWQTEQCDLIATDLTGLRAVVKCDIGKESLNRIIDYKTTDVDRQRAATVMARYHTLATNTLVHALPLSSYVYYHTLFSAGGSNYARRTVYYKS